MVFCPKCGIKYKKSKKFCPKCGAEFRNKPKTKLYLSIVAIIFLSLIILLIFFSDNNLQIMGLNKGLTNLGINTESLFSNKEVSTGSEVEKIDYCGDGVCSLKESCKTCIKDCGDCREKVSPNKGYCGDGICIQEECESGCWTDCTHLQCENVVCEPEKGENCVNAPNDCKCGSNELCDQSLQKCVKATCGNNICDLGETYLTCPQDCKGENYRPEDTSNINYPLIFVHGHSLTNKESSYSINAFSEFQDKLEQEGYYDNKGYILASNEKTQFVEGQWSKLSKPASFRTTYYRGEYSDLLNPNVMQDDGFSITTYAERLSKTIEIVLYATGKSKVDIIAHSMGGLVAREYIRRYGTSKVNKLVTIGTPNQGVYPSNKAGFGCEGIIGWVGGTFFGAGRTQSSPECQDMLIGSPFLTALAPVGKTRGEVKYLTIAGLACYDPNDPANYGDGLIRVTSVYLDGAENIVFNRPDYSSHCVVPDLHSDLIHPSKVQESYNKIVEFLTH